MFGSRRYRSPNQPHTSTTLDPNATTAAAAVFKRQQSNASLLSAAAAAAALQAYPTAPTRVADVQTKRTLRRSSSVASSATAASDLQGRPGLQRRGSSGSMTERTFRTPSPHRPGSSGLGRQNSYSRTGDMPPVPALPRDVETESLRSGVDTRHATTNSLGMRTTPLKLASQTLGRDDAPSWFGAAKMGDPGNVRRTDPAMASPPSSPPQVPLDQSPVEIARSSSRTSSINFSYPKRAKVGSPTSSPVESRFPADIQNAHSPQRIDSHPQSTQRSHPETAASPPRRRPTSSESDQTLVYDPNSRRMVPRAELLAVEQAVLGASQKPVKTRRRKQTSQSSAGSHLAQGTVGRSKSLSSRPDKEPDSSFAKPRAFPLKSDTGPETQDFAEEPAVKAIITSPRIEAKRFEQQRANTSTCQPRVPERAEVIEPVMLPSPRTTVRRQPSVVKEESEPEDWDSTKEVQKNVSQALDSVPSRQRLYEAPQPVIRTEADNQTAYHPIITPSAAPALEDRQHQGLADPAVIVPEAALSPPVKPQSPEIRATSNSFRDRTHSMSPPRQAHFGPVHSNLSVIHHPPPRSVSPRKSALKHSSPSRGASPSDEASDASLGLGRRDDQPVTRKKSVRVSFDDENTVVVGESATTNESNSPIVSSPQSRRPWYSSIGRGKKDLASLDDDEVMKPRPALPSFGSIRNKKPRDFSPVEVERPLVRPILESTYSPVSTGSPSLAPSIASTVAEDRRSDPVPLAHSSDHAVGAILGKDLEKRLEGPARIHDPREPLPPVVTSVEGNGYLSDSSSTSSSSEFEKFELSQEAPAAVAKPAQTAASNITANTTAAATNSSGITEGPKDREVTREINIPSISISEPSPGLPESLETKSSNPYFVDIPGGFPDDDSEPSVSEGAKTIGADTSAYISASQVSSPATTNQPAATSPSAQLQAAEQPSDSESSIYSDAYEDLSEIEGGGFLSLDAVLESSPSPLTGPQTAPPLAEKAPEQPKVQEQAAQLEVQPQVAQPTADAPAHGPSQDDWEKAKAYWRTLTADKRAQLEREALEEAGMDADLEEVPAVQKPKKKKSLERRNSERKALAVHLAQQMMAKQQNGQASNPTPSRSYMIKPGTKWPEPEGTTSTLRTSMRGETGKHSKPSSSSDIPHFRKSLRQGNEGSQPASKARHAALPAPIPVPQPQPTTNGQVHKGTAVSKQQSGFSPIKRRGSTDSESSFKRTRASGSTHQGFGFRKSMRQASSPPEAAAPRQNKRFSLRSLSPMSASGGGGSRQVSEQPPVSMANNQMRRTLRDSSDERKSPSSKMHMPSFGLAAGGKKNTGKKGFKAKSSSRFADSSDEDDVGGGGRGFRSRFEDSSDEDVVAPMPVPVPLPKASRGTASPKGSPSLGPAGPPAARRHLRNQDSVASTALLEELEESENSDNEKVQGVGDEKVAPPESPLQPRTGSGLDTELRRTRSGRGSLIVPTSKSAPVVGTNGTATTTVRPGSSSSKRSSFMSALKRKKHTSSSGSGTGGDKISRPGIAESAARRDTKLERSVGQLRGIRDNVDVVEEGEEDELEIEAPQSPASPPKSPRLQKRILSFTRSSTTGTGTAAGTEDAATPGEFGPNAEVAGFGVGGGLKRPATSGNLGTRTLSGGSISVSGAERPAFLQNRVASTGVMSLDAATTGSVVGTPQKKKKFGALRRMFGLND